MPRVAWASDEEIYDIIAFLKLQGRPVDTSFVGQVGKVEAGRRLVREYDCRACHRIVEPDSGRDRFPELTHVGARRTRQWLVKWLADPQAVKPGTFMPTYPLSSDEVEAIAEYLATLK